MNEHTRRVIEWARGHPEVRSFVKGVPNMPLVERGNQLRTAAGNARVQLPEVNFEAVDWARAVRVLRW